MRLSKFIQPLLFIFALLFVQQGAVSHSITHVLAEQSHEQSLPHDKHCDLCAEYAQVGSAIGSHFLPFEFSNTAEITLTTHHTFTDSISFSAFTARAPPRQRQLNS